MSLTIRTEEEAYLDYLSDAYGVRGEKPVGIVFPRSEGEVVALAERAESEGMKIIPVGAKTGTAGGILVGRGERAVLLAFDRPGLLDSVRIERGSKQAVVGPGVRAGTLRAEAESAGLFYPDLVTVKEATLGGNFATNASSAHSDLYGPTRDQVLAARLVLAGGEALVLRRGEIRADREGGISFSLPSGRRISFRIPSYPVPRVKHQAGYYTEPGMDLLDLFIGSEGTLGIVTEIALRLYDPPEDVSPHIVVLESTRRAIGFLQQAREALGRCLRAAEWLDETSLRIVEDLLPAEMRSVLCPGNVGIYFETERTAEKYSSIISLIHPTTDEASLRPGVLYHAMVESGARSERLRAFKAARNELPKRVNETVYRRNLSKKAGDFVVPEGRLPEMLAFVERRLAGEGIEWLIWGHALEHHLHLNLLGPAGRERVEGRALEKYGAKSDKLLLETGWKAIDLGGTYAGEHPTGKHPVRLRLLREMIGESGLLEMAAIKRALDPNLTLNPGVLIPPNYF